MTQDKTWPWRTALAWALTRDNEFTRLIHEYPGLHLNGLSPLGRWDIISELETQMKDSGCFQERRKRIKIADGLKRITVLEYTLRPEYRGRFQELAEAFEKARTEAKRLSVADFLLNWSADVEREMFCAQLPMEDANGDIPPAVVRRLSSNNEGELVCPEGYIRDMATIDREALVFRFPAPTIKRTAAAQSKCRDWLVGLMTSSPKKRTSPKLALYKQACDDFPGIGSASNVGPSRSFETAWREALKQSGATSWGAAGRTRKSPH